LGKLKLELEKMKRRRRRNNIGKKNFPFSFSLSLSLSSRSLAIQCPQPLIPLNGKIDSTSGGIAGQRRYAVGALLTFSCNEGHVLQGTFDFTTNRPMAVE
jgi:hypothetical protein